MKGTSAAAFAILLALSVRVTAQGDVADGVLAFVNGDYERAAEILRPLAEKPVPDPDAAFFMGTMYDEGRGVPADPLRACAHFMQAGEASIAAGDPFARTATYLLGPVAFLASSPDAIEDCSYLSIVGFNTRFRAETFQFGPGHWVDWDQRGATVWYQGTSKRLRNEFQPTRGGVYFPLKHLELQTGPARSDRRDFIEVALWQPVIPNFRWQLEWHLFEVVRGDLVHVAVDITTVADQANPPEASDTVLDEFVRVAVNDDGDAAWTLIGHGTPEPHVIETEADREEDRAERERGKAQQAARERAWKDAASRRLDPNRKPALTFAADDVEGCGLVDMEGWTTDRTEAIVLRSLAHNDRPGTSSFDLARDVGSVSLEVHVYNMPTGSDFCSDALSISSNLEEHVWRATAGSVRIDLSPRNARRIHREARVTIADAVFVSPSGETVRLSSPVVMTASVGVFAGGMIGRAADFDSREFALVSRMPQGSLPWAFRRQNRKLSETR